MVEDQKDLCRFSYFDSAILQPSKMKPVLVEKLLYLPSAKSTLVQKMAAVEIFKIFRLLQNSKKRIPLLPKKYPRSKPDVR